LEVAKDKEFVFKEALLEYCHLDVSILTQGCMKMRHLIMDEHDIDPFVVAPTIASLCMSVYFLFCVPDMVTSHQQILQVHLP
jgi:hypothetical protein